MEGALKVNREYLSLMVITPTEYEGCQNKAVFLNSLYFNKIIYQSSASFNSDTNLASDSP